MTDRDSRLARLVQASLGELGLLRPQLGRQYYGIHMLGAYDPARIPVLMIHGLRSSPHIWRSLTELLFRDPDLARSYQVWHYFYPTDAPYLYAALELRRRLDAFYASFASEPGREPRKLVLIGHSMGGILARALTVNSHWQLWDAAFTIRPDEFVMPAAQRHELEQILRLDALPYVSRALLLATPNRGSDAALGWAAAIARRLLALPDTLRQVFGPLQHTPLGHIRNELRATFKRGGPSSLDALSPRHPVLLALALLPSTVPFHQIIGVVKRQPGSMGSDGVVTFESCVLPDAASTLTVPRHHGDFDAPEVLAEIRRILLLHLASVTAR
jgi:pimeloyl-ACP methyl ester carboxylesterase